MMVHQNETSEVGSVSTPVFTISPIVLKVPGRPVDLQMKISAPTTGSNLPIILLSHGHGMSNNLSSLNGYGPLANYWAANGFVVIQPTHLSSKTLAGIVDTNGPEGPLFWHSRAKDMKQILDQLDFIESSVPELKGRMNQSKIAIVGHSLGGHTAGLLAGMRATDPSNGEVVNLTEPRIKAAVLIGAPGGSTNLASKVAQLYPVFKTTDFTHMTMPALIVAGDKDKNPAFSEKDDWRAEAYFLSPAPKCLLTVFGGEHILGGISGYDAAETTDENPERVALVRELIWAYLRTALYPNDTSWQEAQKALKEDAVPKARIECK